MDPVATRVWWSMEGRRVARSMEGRRVAPFVGDTAIAVQSMGLLKIPHPILTKPAKDIGQNMKRELVHAIFTRMFQVMSEHKGVGLAAPQIGIELRMIVGAYQNWSFHVMNPVLEPVGREVKRIRESCFSCPGTVADVNRARRVRLQGWDANGKWIDRVVGGMMAGVLQHEVDHLDGITLENPRDLRTQHAVGSVPDLPDRDAGLDGPGNDLPYPVAD